MKYLLLTFLFAMMLKPVLADSPLTSTSFSDAYADNAMVIKAGENGGLLNDELMAYLADNNQPIDVRMAVINKLSWDFNGKSNATTFFNYLKQKNKYKSEKDFKKKAKADELLCYAYLKALDNYFDVKEAVVYADLAIKKNKTSYTFQIIAALIKAQAAFDTDWCKVFQTTNEVRNNTLLRADMKSTAIDIIFEYMDLYADSCA
jgi:hypothetical protein